MTQTYHFYILKCSDGSYYVGSATNLDDRVDRHNQGRGSSYTAKRRPVQLVYHEKLGSLDDAMKRERQLKKWSRAKKEALINGELETLKRLSKNRDI
jgi:predicted GIY-YIG superfamily endonuclease